MGESGCTASLPALVQRRGGCAAAARHPAISTCRSRRRRSGPRSRLRGPACRARERSATRRKHSRGEHIHVLVRIRQTALARGSERISEGEPRSAAARRRHDAHPDAEGAARAAFAPRRHRGAGRAARHRSAGLDAHDRRRHAPQRRARAPTRCANAIPALAELAGRIGDPAVRNCGTIGGSVANNDPAADYPAAVLALGAKIVTEQARDRRRRFLPGPVHDRARAGRAHRAHRLPGAEARGVREIRASRVGLRDDGRVRGGDRERRARGGDRRGPGRLPLEGSRSRARRRRSRPTRWRACA